VVNPVETQSGCRRSALEDSTGYIGSRACRDSLTNQRGQLGEADRADAFWVGPEQCARKD